MCYKLIGGTSHLNRAASLTPNHPATEQAMSYVRLSLIPVLLVLQSACQFQIGALPRSTQSTANKTSPQRTATTRNSGGPEHDAYVKDVRKQWENDNYEWLESEARRVQTSKERLPGGYWKLRVLYRSIEAMVNEDSSEESWKEHIAHVKYWIKQRPTSVMPRIILAEVWRAYAWKARGTGFASTVKEENWAPFKERLEKTNEILAEAATLDDKSPEWYLTSLLAARGQGGDREAFEQLYQQSVALEPNYYYLYQAKAGYLLPQWYGEPGEWERFAEAAADEIGGDQGNIILFTVYSDRMSNSNLGFMDKHKAIASRLMAGFRAIDKLYGSSPQR